jgi:glycyl-tRNA synthetase (class II)
VLNRRDQCAGIGQIGKAFRNEVSPSHFLFRTREFEQCELEYFCKEEQVDEALAQWLEASETFLHQRLALPRERLRRRGQRAAGSSSDDATTVEGAHYAQPGGFDIEYRFAFGWAELCGLANRGQHDTARHQLYPHEKDGGRGAGAPYVVEPSFGLDRLVLATLDAAWQPALVTPVGAGDVVKRDVLCLPRHLAPIKLAVLPLMRQQPLTDVRQIHYHYAASLIDIVSSRLQGKYMPIFIKSIVLITMKQARSESDIVDRTKLERRVASLLINKRWKIKPLLYVFVWKICWGGGKTSVEHMMV